jgi:hypothetical protein
MSFSGKRLRSQLLYRHKLIFVTAALGEPSAIQIHRAMYEHGWFSNLFTIRSHLTAMEADGLLVGRRAALAASGGWKVDRIYSTTSTGRALLSGPAPAMTFVERMHKVLLPLIKPPGA